MEGGKRDPASVREFNRFFRALTNSTRREILFMLNEGEYSVGEMVAALGLVYPVASLHLRVLSDAGLVTFERRGQQVFYSLDHEALHDASDRFFGAF